MLIPNIIEYGDCREIMEQWIWDDVKVQTCVTSPPYFGLRDYKCEGQLGLEKTPDEYVANLVKVFRLVRDLLTDDGTLWLNLGDSYAGSWGNQGRKKERGTQRPILGEMMQPVHDNRYPSKMSNTGKIPEGSGLKPKDLIGIPWMVAFALRVDEWYLRQDIIWAKPNPMPESVRDRCTKAHEYIFLLTKSPKYYFDGDAIAEPLVTKEKENYPARAKVLGRGDQESRKQTPDGQPHQDSSGGYLPRCYRGSSFIKGRSLREGVGQGERRELFTKNKRSVWTITTKPYKGAHFATFPYDLIEPCILAGSRPRDVVLDPFMGSGTTAQVALKHGRNYLGCELNPEYKQLCEKRLDNRGN